VVIAPQYPAEPARFLARLKRNAALLFLLNCQLVAIRDFIDPASQNSTCDEFVAFYP
jgi:hypothetical protein